MFRIALALIAVVAVQAQDAQDRKWESIANFGIDPATELNHCVYNSSMSLVGLCQSRISKKYGPPSTSVEQPTWLRCCEYFAELNCYWLENKYFCKQDYLGDSDTYLRNMGFFLQDSVCGLVRFIGGQPSCDKKIYLANAAYYNKSGHFGGEFVSLPLAETKLVRSCMDKAKTQKSNCVKTALDRYDPERRKIFESTLYDACCAEYSMIDCFVNSAAAVCSSEEMTAVKNYQKKALSALNNTVCAPVKTSSCH